MNIAATPPKLPDGWLEVGHEVLAFICKRLRISPTDVNAEACAYEAGDLAKLIGTAALLSRQAKLAQANAQLAIRTAAGKRGD